MGYCSYGTVDTILSVDTFFPNLYGNKWALVILVGQVNGLLDGRVYKGQIDVNIYSVTSL